MRRLVIALILSCSSAARADVLADRLQEEIRRSGGREISVTVAGVTGAPLASLAGATMRKPASVLKLVLTAALLLDKGAYATIPTDVFLEDGKGGARLFLRGHGDPSFTTETALKLAERLTQYGVKRVREVVLDTSLWDGVRERTGTRAYSTGASPLPYNFNAIGFVACPSMSGGPAALSTDPPNLAVELSGTVKTVAGNVRELSIQEEVPAKRYRVSGSVGRNGDCAMVYRSAEDPIALVSAGIERALTSVGLPSTPQMKEGRVPPDARLLFTFRSKHVGLMLRDLNLFSTNFIAEQLLHWMGGREGGYDRNRGLERLEQFLSGIGVPKQQFHLADASGLSHDNRITSNALVRVIQAGLANARSAPDFEASLSLAGESGTLEKRSFGVPAVVRGKTGSLNGVSSLAGSVMGRSGAKRVFVVISNDGWDRGRAQALEDRIVRIIYEAS